MYSFGIGKYIPALNINLIVIASVLDSADVLKRGVFHCHLAFEWLGILRPQAL